MQTQTTTSTLSQVMVRTATAVTAIVAVVAITAVGLSQFQNSNVGVPAGAPNYNLRKFAYPGDDIENAEIQIQDTLETVFIGEMRGIGDINGDGYEELALADDLYSGGKGRVYVYLGGANMQGQYSLADADFTITGLNGGDYLGKQILKLGDIDGDAKADIALSRSSGSQASPIIYIYFGSSFTKSQLAIADSNTKITDSSNRFLTETAVSGGDINGDGKWDIAMGAPSPVLSKDIQVLFSNHLLPNSTIDISTQADAIVTTQNGIQDVEVSISLGDINGDQKADLGYLDNAVDPKKVYVFSGANLVASRTHQYNSAILKVSDVAGATSKAYLSLQGDVNGGGRHDVVVLHFDSHQVRIFTSEGRPLAGEDISMTLPNATISSQEPRELMVSADVDLDGTTDIVLQDVVGNPARLSVDVYLSSTQLPANRTQPNYRAYEQSVSTSNNGHLTTADVDGNGLQDVFVITNEVANLAVNNIYGITSPACDPSDTIYVDTNGLPGAPGGIECPVSSIQAGIDLARSSGLTEVRVYPGRYTELVRLRRNIHLHGLSSGDSIMPNGSVHAVIVSPGAPNNEYTVIGADNTDLKYFEIQGSVDLEGVELMNIHENIIVNEVSAEQPTIRLVQSSNNSIENNILIRKLKSAPTARNRQVVLMHSNSKSNTFKQNVIHYSSDQLMDTFGIELEPTSTDNTFINNAIMGTLTAGVNSQFVSIQGGGQNARELVNYNFLSTQPVSLFATPGAKNLIGTNPKFTRLYPDALFNYSLQASSPLLNNGDPSIIDVDGTRSDVGAIGGPIKFDLLP